MGDNGFQVDTGVLRNHAQQMGDVKAQVDQVSDAGKQVTPGGWDNAYGLICQAFPQGTRPLAELQLAGIRKISEYYQRAIEGINADAERYDTVEDQVKRSLEEALEQLESISPIPTVPGGDGMSTDEPMPHTDEQPGGTQR